MAVEVSADEPDSIGGDTLILTVEKLIIYHRIERYAARLNRFKRQHRVVDRAEAAVGHQTEWQLT